MKYSAELKPKDIVEAFPSECREYVNIVINKLQKEIDFYKKLEHEAKYYTTNQVLRVFLLESLNMYKPEDKIKYLKKIKIIKNILDGNVRNNNLVTDNDVLEAKKISIVTLHPFKKAKMFGNRFTACCPFHNEKTPSFTVFADNHYHCFGCNKTGDSINFIQELNNLTFIDAVKFLNAQKF